MSKESSNNTTVIIVTYNAMTWLQKCLNSIPNEYPVIVVDNHSGDATVSYIKENFPKIHLIENTENKGFGQANNQGISHALADGAEAVFLLNQDAYLENDTVSTLENVCAQHKDFGVLSPIHWNGTRKTLDRNFHYYATRSIPMVSDLLRKENLDTVYEVPFVNAAGWFIPKSTLNTIGGFDPLFFHYGEDENYCQRLRYHGLKVGIVPTSHLIHDRQDRVVAKPSYASEAYFMDWKRKMLLKYADINTADAMQDLQNLISKKKRAYLKATLRFRLNNKHILKQELAYLASIKPLVSTSRQKNKVKFNHYL